MPSVPTSKKCHFLGCKEDKIFGTNFCAAHGAKRSERYKKSEKLYNSAGWKSIKATMRSQHPLCASCLSRGIIAPTEHIDHVIPHRQDTAKFMVNVFQGLCAACHSQKTLLEKQGIYRHYTPDGPVDYSDSDYGTLIQEKIFSPKVPV
jgi:5-methylcytosine-specific restriction enzyme A